MSALRDMNIAKLVPADIPLFLCLLSDIFPSVTSVPSKSHSGLREALQVVAKKTKVRADCMFRSRRGGWDLAVMRNVLPPISPGHSWCLAIAGC
jgi:hypothetical protein